MRNHQLHSHPDTSQAWARDAFARGQVTVATLIHDGVAEHELCQALKTFHQAGCTVETVGIHSGLVQAFNGSMPGHHYLVGRTIDQVDADSYAALFVPGGAASLAALRDDDGVGVFIQHFASQEKPIAISSDAATLVAAAAPDVQLIAADEEGHHAALLAVRLLIDRMGSPGGAA